MVINYSHLLPLIYKFISRTTTGLVAVDGQASLGMMELIKNQGIKHIGDNSRL